MNTLKNAALLVVMGGVLYFVYITLNKPPAPPGTSVALQHESLTPPEIEMQPLGSGDDTTSWNATPALTETSQTTSTYEVPTAPTPFSTEQTATDATPRMVPVPSAPVADMAGGNSAYGVVNPAPGGRRNGGWNANSANNNGPPIAPELPEYSVPNSTTNPAPEMAESSPAGSNGGEPEFVPASPDGTPRVDPNVAKATLLNDVEATNATNAALVAYTVKQKFTEAKSAIDQGRFREALEALTVLYKRSDLAPADRDVIVQWLDPLAGKVIYSSEHTLAEAYRVGRGEDLLTVSQRLQVPWQLLQNINGVRDPQVVVPNTMLKVVPGPFHADVNLQTHEMTLYLKEMYAGRFSFAVGEDAPQPGQYLVLDKSLDHAFYGRDGRMIAAKDPANPYGGWWIDLGRGAVLHGSPISAGAAQKNLGCMSFSPQDAQDIFSILSIGSPVTIR